LVCYNHGLKAVVKDAPENFPGIGISSNHGLKAVVKDLIKSWTLVLILKN
jgi:hypothetical protein